MRTRLGPFSIARARRLRRDATGVERKLWWKLRELKQLGYHFRRQAPFRNYILDFVEHNHRLAIELNGGQHGFAENAHRDIVRDRTLECEGYRVLRFSNHAVTENIDAVVEGIVRVLQERPPPPSYAHSVSSGGRPPHEGEVE